MNEKLKKELERFQESKEFLETPLKTPDNTLIAEHFYNLALADVKDEIMRLVKINKELATRPFIEGIVAGYSDVLSVIRQLTN